MFSEFKKLLQSRITHLLSLSKNLYVVDVDKDLMWETYINGFPQEERQNNTCNSCRSFIRHYGGLVIIHDNKIHTIWDIKNAPVLFDKVTAGMHELISNAPIVDMFVTKLAKLGTDKNIQLLEDKTTVTWQHLFYELPKTMVNTSSDSEASVMGEFRSIVQVFERSLNEITPASVETVLELIAQNSLYRGAESTATLEKFKQIQKEYLKLPIAQRSVYVWSNASKHGASVSKIRNTAIGTLLVDISNGEDLDKAVSAFERIMAPANYKRPNAIITKKMIEDAEKTIDELGYTNSLGRRFAVPEDVTVNNVLFVDRSAGGSILGGILDELKDALPVNPKQFNKVEEISVADFLSKVLPKATSVEVLFENKYINNLVSLIAPKDASAPSMFKWGNNFSWTYKDSLADSMKERVKAAGGNVEGVLRFSIQWNQDGRSIVDLDAHAYEPGGTHIYFSTFKGRKTDMSGMLDVDMINPSGIGVENITWIDRKKMKTGNYVMQINNYNDRQHDGCQAEIEFDGQLHSFNIPGKIRGTIDIAVVTLKDGVFTIKSKLESDSVVSSTSAWGIDTNKFQPVTMIMKSPNYWDGHGVGNQHLFFIMQAAHNDEVARGFFNEFLDPKLDKHKRVFEALGGKMKVEPADKQLSGLGFSDTQHNSVIVKVKSNLERVLKIKF